MDVLGMYLLQRVSDELTIQKYKSFEKRFYSSIPNDPVARLEHDGYVTSSKDAGDRISQGSY